MAKAKAFSVATYFKQVAKRGGTKTRKTRAHSVETLETSLGTKLAPDVRAFVTFHLDHEVKDAIGRWRTRDDAGLLERAQALPEFLTAWGPVFVAACTRTIHLGKDGSGCEFFVEANPARSEVFIHHPGAPQLVVLADSLTTFLEINDVIERWDRLADAHEIDVEELDEVDTTQPAFVDIRERARALLGRVNLASGSDYDETLVLLAKKKTKKAKLRAKSNVGASYERMMWLMLLLLTRKLGRKRGEIEARLDAGRTRNPKAAKLPLYALWHDFLYAPDNLASTAERAATDPSALVRAIAARMTRVTARNAIRRLDAMFDSAA